MPLFTCFWTIYCLSFYYYISGKQLGLMYVTSQEAPDLAERLSRQKPLPQVRHFLASQAYKPLTFSFDERLGTLHDMFPHALSKRRSLGCKSRLMITRDMLLYSQNLAPLLGRGYSRNQLGTHSYPPH